MMIRRRLRGILGTTITVTLPWTALGFLTGVAFQFDLIPGVHASIGSQILGGVVTVCTLAGAMVGAVNGLTFAGILLATERGKNVDDLRASRVAIWSALATAGTLGLLFKSPVAAVIGGAIGGVAGLVALRIARRATSPLPEPAATE